MTTPYAPNPAELYSKRMRRVLDAVSLKVPDRVPLIPQFEAYPLAFSGVAVQSAMYNYDLVGSCFDQFYCQFQPDLGWSPGTIYYAKALESCGIEWLRWPGNGISDPNQLFQFVEAEYMLASEYDEFIHDPTHFIQSKWIPRCFSKLKGFSNLRLRDSLWVGFLDAFSKFADPEVIDSLSAMIQTARQLKEWSDFASQYEHKMESEMGFPMAVGASAFAPFDQLGDTLRGTENILIDLIERPEKVLAAVEALLPIAVEAPIIQCKGNGRRFVWIWLHKGLDEFMSTEQYRTFYWPTLQQMILILVENDLIPIVYCEGRYNSRLEVLRGVPPGKVVYDFENVDMFKAKELLGDIACIAGNLPNALLISGGPEEVEAYCRRLIEGVGRKGGFMLDAAAIIDNARVENLRAMFDSVEKYGKSEAFK
jgi:uroporphyrinogen-III decarboxylase